jgi:hypothetical protein
MAGILLNLAEMGFRPETVSVSEPRIAPRSSPPGADIRMTLGHGATTG